MILPRFKQGLALYVHWPFCLAKCPYCDFNSHVREHIEEQRWRQAFLLELTRLARLTGPHNLTSIFFGGGTPSLMHPQTLEAIIVKASELYSVVEPLEITLEANPNTVEHFAAFKSVGVNRISLGVQSFSASNLAFLGRNHGVAEAIQAIETAQQLFPRVSFDLMYALPQQDRQSWRRELETALAFGTGHLSLYQLTIESGTVFAKRYAQGKLAVIDAEQAAMLYEMTEEMLEQAGMPAYEISNHAKAGEASRHNLSYWRYEDYGGIGPGAHGRITVGTSKRATQQIRAPEKWLAKVYEGGSGEESAEELTPHTQAVEALMMGLRLAEGIATSKLQINQIIDPSALSWLKANDFISQDSSILKATPKGRQRLNAVLEMLLR